MVLSKKQEEEKDKLILLVVKTFLENKCQNTDQELSEILNIPRTTIGRYLTSTRTKELIGIDNYAYIKRERIINKINGRRKGGSRKKND